MPNQLQMSREWLANKPAWMKAGMLAVFAVMTYIAVFLAVQDYQTSRLGYMLLPSQKVDPETTAALVGLLPQLLQIAMMWVGATKPQARKLAIILWLVAFVPDFAADLMFKMNWAVQPEPYLAAVVSTVIETLFLFTLGSEFLLVLSWANLTILIEPYTEALFGGIGNWWAGVQERANAFAAEAGTGAGAMFGFEEPPPPPNRKKRGGGK